MKQTFTFTLLMAASLLTGICQARASNALEIGKRNRDDLPRGKEADGIVGDFVLRNDKVQALVSGNQPLRRANMSTFYGTNGITPGCLYDLTLNGAHNDQITIFAPADQRGPVSYVRIAEPGGERPALVETVVSAPSNDGLFKRHEYSLPDDAQGLDIKTTLRNESDTPVKQDIADRWTTFSSAGSFRGYRWADAVDPSDRAGYAFYCDCTAAVAHPTNIVSIAPGGERIISRFLAVGHSPAEAVGIAAQRRGEVGRIEAALTDAENNPAGQASIRIFAGKEQVIAYANDEGRASFPFLPGQYEIEIASLGSPTNRATLAVRAGETARIEHKFGAASGIALIVRDEAGADIPCKAQFIGIEGTPSPNFGPQNRAHGCRDQYHSETGSFKVSLAPGHYRVIVTRGIEYSHIAQDIEVRPGEVAQLNGQLTRMLDTTGWVSADYHNHSTPSGDNTCGTDDRIINLAAEHIEFAPTTEHNRLYDWQPHIDKLGLTRFISTVKGLELTGSGPHFNSFPFTPQPGEQDSGAPVWNRDPRITAALLRNHQGHMPERWIQINHPDLIENFVDRDGDGLADGGYIELGRMIDAVETENFSPSTLLQATPVRIFTNRTTKALTVVENREFIWLQLLNRGHRLTGMAVADAHSVHGNGVGGWRMYMPSKTDEPSQIDWRENSRHARAGRSILTTGPFLQVETSDGILPGGDARASDQVTLKVRVQCNDWIDIDRVQVLVNGRQEPKLNFTRKTHPDWFADGIVKFEREIPVKLEQDAHLIVVACSETQDLKLGYGSSDQSILRPFAYHNPIYVDVDGGGFKPNGDMLGFPAVPAKYTLDQARELIHQHDHEHRQDHAH